MLSSFATNLYSYVRERLATRRVALLLAFLTAMSLIADPQQEWQGFLVRALTLAILVSQFRLWDGLADRVYDRLNHPGRLLVRIRDMRHFWVLLALTTIVSVVLVVWLSGTRSLLVYIALAGMLLGVYRGHWQVLKNRTVRAQLVLLKYPAFLAMIVPGEPDQRLLIATLLAYAVLTVHEWFDDRVSRQVLEG